MRALTESSLPSNANLFLALRAGFPPQRQRCAVQTDGGLEYSWQDLDEATAMLAHLLQSLGLPPGARVAAQVDKSVEAMLLYLAVLRAGLVFVPLNMAYQSAEMAYFIGDAQPAVLVCSGANFVWLSKLAFTAGCEYVFTLNDDRSGSLLERAAAFSRQHSVAHRDAQDLAAIIYTSGTTGRSKGAMLSHGNLLSNAQVLQQYWGWRAQPRDVLLHALPIFHVHGLFVAIHAALISGSKMLWLARFEPKTVLSLLPQATVFMGVPTLYVRLLAEPGLNQAAVRNMRLFISGSAPLLIETFQEWQQRTGHTILERYGMSETIMLTSNPYFVEAGARVGGTVGRPLPGVQLRVTDAQGVVLGDLIISGGYNVYPAEVEGYINALPEVAESALVGVPDADFGEVGVAVVVAKAGSTLQPDALIAQLKATLANFKVPKRCYVVGELPRNAMGKVQKNLLRTHYGKT